MNDNKEIMSLYENQAQWRPPEPQSASFTPKITPHFLSVDWEFDGKDVWIIDVTANGKTIRQHLKDSDIEAFREEAATMVEGGVR